ncbi:hypothetical protein G7054_g5889 [Neopestalotiopsis clavispora]|nr:hypothetical protein G7054_g5889 [Neopestalotiopsis clavispora]
MVAFHEIILALTSVLVVRAAVSECFYLKGTTAGRDLGYASVAQPSGNKNYLSTFANNGAAASKFGIDPKNGELRVFTTGNNVNGRTAAVAPKTTSAFLIFDTKTSMLLAGRKALVCGLKPATAATTANSVLSCAAGDNAAVSVSQYCPTYWSIANRERTDLGCTSLVLQAIAAPFEGCGNFSTGIGSLLGSDE